LVIEMARSTPVWLGSEFDNFLFAPISDDRNGMVLSVVSALARLDVDPWQEAAELTRLPGDAATERLSLLIATLPAGSPMLWDPKIIAARLVALLPRHGAPDFKSRNTLLPGVGAVNRSRAAIYGILYLIFMGLVLGSQCTMADRQPQAQIGATDASPLNEALRHVPPPSSRDR
jgi:hypothetical protein